MVESPNSEEKDDWMNAWTKHAGVDFLEYPREINHSIRFIIANKTAQAGKTVLDVGCATCIDYPLHKKNGVTYTGLDPTKKFLDRAVKLYPDVNVKLGNVFELPYNDEVFSVTYCKDLFEHLPPNKYKQAAKEMWRVAEVKVMVAFFIAPKNVETRYMITKNGYYNNQYNKTEIVKFFSALPNIRNMNITENIGYNKSALYELTKRR